MKEGSSAKPYVAQLSKEQIKKLQYGLKERDFEFSTPEYTTFQARKEGISCTLYTSGKLVVQGKQASDFIEYFLEPEILETFDAAYGHLKIETTPRIGIDESGKGDFFGPLCIAGVYAQGEEFQKLHEMGVKDSKSLSDAQIHKLASKIRQHVAHHVVRINPLKYNELYSKFRNLNTLLGWGHATAIESLIKKTDCHKVIIDQFASEHVVIQALQKKNVSVDLHQRHRGEEDIVVAAASILAREAFLDGLDKLGQTYGIKLPKGVSAGVIEAGKQFIERHGKESLQLVGKLHFKTLDAILNGKYD